jgi:hypothetical protein
MHTPGPGGYYRRVVILSDAFYFFLFFFWIGHIHYDLKLWGLFGRLGLKSSNIVYVNKLATWTVGNL